MYSHNARLTIQKLNVDRDSIPEGGLTWVPGTGWKSTVEGDSLVNPALLNSAVYEAADGPGYYNAEVNVKGKIIYGYTWALRDMNEGTGSYRITFSFDSEGGPVALNTFFDELTQILVPIEEEAISKIVLTANGETEDEDGEGSRGGKGIIDVSNNLTYMDVRIVEGHGEGGGGGGGGHHGPGGGGGHGN